MSLVMEPTNRIADVVSAGDHEEECVQTHDAEGHDAAVAGKFSDVVE